MGGKTLQDRYSPIEVDFHRALGGFTITDSPIEARVIYVCITSVSMGVFEL